MKQTDLDKQLANGARLERIRAVRDVLLSVVQASVANPHWSAGTLLTIGATLKGTANTTERVGLEMPVMHELGTGLQVLAVGQELEQFGSGIGDFIVRLIHGDSAQPSHGNDAPVLFSIPSDQQLPAGPNPFVLGAGGSLPRLPKESGRPSRQHQKLLKG